MDITVSEYADRGDIGGTVCDDSENQPIARRRVKRHCRYIHRDANTSAWLTHSIDKTHIQKPIGDKKPIVHKKSSKLKNKWMVYTGKVARELRRLHARSDSKHDSGGHTPMLDQHDKLVLNDIKVIMQKIVNENKSHQKHPEFEGPGDEFNVESIVCSKCGGIDSENDDLYFCDAEDCCRAYHLRCLDPPVSPHSISADPQDDWFCNQCRCIADCLVLINQALGSFYCRLAEFYAAICVDADGDPELRTPAGIDDSDRDSLVAWAEREPHREDLPDTILLPACTKKEIPNEKAVDTMGPESALVIKRNVDKQQDEADQTQLRARSSTYSQQLLECDLSMTSVDTKRGFTDNYFYYEDGVTPTIWNKCYKTVNRHVLQISKLNHCVNVLSMNGHNDGVALILELKQQMQAVKKRKLAVREALQSVVSANQDHTRFSELDAVLDDGMVEVEGVNCSKCGLPDSEGNDILFCDRKGCCRAYHAACLDPPLHPDLISSDPAEDWFCWECRCVADSLALINEMCGTFYDDGVQEVFADVVTGVEEEEGGDLLEGVWGGESSSEDDDDYLPAGHGTNTTAHPSNDDDDDDDVSSCDEEDDEHLEEEGDGGASDEGDENVGEAIVSSPDSGIIGEEYADGPKDELESDLSGDELHQLMVEAGGDVDIPSHYLHMCSIESHSETSTGGVTSQGLISSRLRKRKLNSEDEDLPQGFMPLRALCAANVSIDLPVARVRAGKFELGRVVGLPSRTLSDKTDPPPADGNSRSTQIHEYNWCVLYAEKFEVQHSLEALRDAYECRIDYEKRVRRLLEQEKSSQVAVELEKLSEENVLNEKRMKKKHNYAQLHLDMFGSEDVFSDSDEDFSDIHPEKKQRRKKKVVQPVPTAVLRPDPASALPQEAAVCLSDTVVASSNGEFAPVSTPMALETDYK